MERNEVTVQIQLFARYAELMGREWVEVDVSPGGTVADAIGAVRALPGGESLPARILVARGLEQVTPDEILGAGDELAFLPPMSGG